MRKNEIEYDCVLLSDEALENIRKILKENKIDYDLPFQENMHCTLKYFGFKDEDRTNQLTSKELGVDVELYIDKLGLFFKNNEIMNIGLHVNKDKSSLESSKFSNKISHITVMINKEAKAKASQTTKCFEKELLEDERSVQIILDKPIVLSGKTVAIKNGIVNFSLEESIPTKEELEKEAKPILALEGQERKKAIKAFLKRYSDVESLGNILNEIVYGKASGVDER